MNTGTGISFVVPAYNEKANMQALHRQVVEVCRQNGYLFEIIIVDDGSTDGTASAVTGHPGTKMIVLRRNYGQSYALDAGIRSARFDCLVTMDGDGQNDPNDIPVLLAALEKDGLDMVVGWRKSRNDSFAKRTVSRVGNLLLRQLITVGIHDSGCTFKAFRKECFANLSLHSEMHRFIPAIVAMRGFHVGEVVVRHRSRTGGRSKYRWTRVIKAATDLLSVLFWHKYGLKPFHLLGGLGSLALLLSAVSGCATIISFLKGQGMSETGLPLLTVFLFLSGIHFLLTGLVADLLLRGYFEMRNDRPYSIKEIRQVGSESENGNRGT